MHASFSAAGLVLGLDLNGEVLGLVRLARRHAVRARVRERPRKAPRASMTTHYMCKRRFDTISRNKTFVDGEMGKKR